MKYNILSKEEKVELVKEAERLLTEANHSYDRIYVYAGCSLSCGKLPRVIVKFKQGTPMCFHLDELKMYIRYGNVWKLWIDDEAYDKSKPQRNPTDDYLVATSVSEAIEITNKQKSPPFFLHLDHDLGKGGRVMDYLKWLNDRYPEYCPQYTVHSENCIGRENIISYIDSWRKSLDL